MKTYGVSHSLLVQPNSGYGGDNSFVRGGQNYTSAAFSVVQPSSFVNVFIKL